MPGLKRRGKGPFRGATPKGIIQTVDVGTGMPIGFLKKTRENPQRKYAIVEPLYGKKSLIRAMLARDPHRVTFLKTIRKRSKVLEKRGVIVRAEKIRDFIKRMVREGIRTRYVNIDMPAPAGIIIDSYGFRELFKKAPEVLLPNGKIFISCENDFLLGILKNRAQKEGLKVRWLKKLHPKAARTKYQKQFTAEGHPIFRLEITYGLKKAIPNKAERRKWPNGGR